MPEININSREINIYSKYLPALYIGGDFYDVIAIKKNIKYVILGDVSGHGISAALLTAMLINMIKNIINKYSSPDKILDKLNKELIGIMKNNDFYACVFIALINTSAKKIFYSNAGQALPIFISDCECKELIISGTPVGLLQNAKYETKVINYKSNDVIFFHTDGLENNFYKNNNESFLFELSKILRSTINSCVENNFFDLPEVINIVLNKFYYRPELNKNQIDDVSMIICKL